ncbi:Holliday junction resolvase RuvX [bacterium]|nr:Holliday junction resolvase RuvX [bacterium]
MALDVGTKRIGVSLSDFLHITANGHGLVEREPEADAIEKIKKIAKENHVKIIVVGKPLNMDGTQGGQADDCIGFAKNFETDFDVVMEDERLTSSEAEANLRAKKIDFRKNKGLVDIESACIILEQYLSRKK